MLCSELTEQDDMIVERSRLGVWIVEDEGKQVVALGFECVPELGCIDT